MIKVQAALYVKAAAMRQSLLLTLQEVVAQEDPTCSSELNYNCISTALGLDAVSLLASASELKACLLI